MYFRVYYHEKKMKEDERVFYWAAVDSAHLALWEKVWYPHHYGSFCLRIFIQGAQEAQKYNPVLCGAVLFSFWLKYLDIQIFTLSCCCQVQFNAAKGC